MANWLITRKGADFNKIAETHGISPVTARLLRNRDIFEDVDVENYLKADINSIQRPETLKDMELAVSIMESSIKNGEKIRVIGDYDVDGICSSFILLSGIKACGGNADVVLPHRMYDGYGLNMSLVENAHNDGVKTIITCDNGIAAIDEIAYAKELGMTVIVTDHHEVGIDEDKDKMILPAADAVVDPKRTDNQQGLFKEICGAVVAYKFIWLLTEKMGANLPSSFYRELRIFAGWATVCDVMPLKGENRIMVLDSIKNIPYTENVGLRQLIRASSLDEYSISCYSYGFVLGPCLNATGRLDSAMRGLELLTESNENVAAKIAMELKELNDSRKDMTVEGTKKALDMLEKYGENLPDVLVIYIADLHESLAGIIAGKVREATNRPVFVITDASDGGVKGSGRSIEAYHMYEALCECRDYLTKFGGHRMAAGFSLKKENIDNFREALNKNSKLSKEDFVPVLHLDMELPIGYLNTGMVREFDKIGPFGQGNPEPLFAARNVELLKGRILGKNANVGKIQVRDEYSGIIDMMVFYDLEGFNEFLDETFGESEREKLYNGTEHDKMKINVAYKPSINEFRGMESLQIVLSDYKKISP